MTETTAQDASGATIAVWDGLKVDLCFTTREVARACGSARIDTRDRSTDRAAHGKRGRGRCRTHGRTERVHRSLENRGRFSTSAHRHHRVLIKQKNGSAHTWSATGLRQLQSSAAVASGAPLLTLCRQK